MPQINLVPMLDVLMSVLTFFILTAMVLTGQRLSDILLPGAKSGAKQEEKPLVIGLDKRGGIVIEEENQESQTASPAELEKAMKAYLQKNPGGMVVLKADRELSYQEVERLLKEMAKIGRENVSLAIEKR